MSSMNVPVVTATTLDKIKNYSICNNVVRKKIVLDRNFNVKPVYSISRIAPSADRRRLGGKTRTTDQLLSEGDYLFKKVTGIVNGGLHLYQMNEQRLVEIPDHYVDGIVAGINATNPAIFQFLNDPTESMMPDGLGWNDGLTILATERIAAIRKFMNYMLADEGNDIPQPSPDEAFIERVSRLSVTTDEKMIPCTWKWSRSMLEFVKNEYVDWHRLDTQGGKNHAIHDYIIWYEDGTFERTHVRPTTTVEIQRIVHVMTQFNSNWVGGGLMWFLFDKNEL